MSHVWKVITLVFVALLGSGCTYITNRNIDNHFPGVEDAVKENKVVCVLFVHGMDGYSTGDPDHMIAAIQSKLKLKVDTNSHLLSTIKLGTLKTQHMSTDTGHEVFFYTLCWTPIATAFKDQYLAGDSDPVRLKLDEDAKQQIINDRLADVFIYEGVGKEEIQESVQESLQIMQKDVQNSVKGNEEYSYVFITWSLGSKIVFDCLDRTERVVPRSEEEENLFDNILGHADSVFMLANQLPLLAMATRQPPTRPSEAPMAPSIHNFIAERNAAVVKQNTPRPTLSIVAVSDPNDVLSYPIPDWFKQQENKSLNNANFANVSISVAHWAVYIPYIGGGGWMINPITAHVGYGSDEEVIRLVIEGHKSGEKAQ